MLSQEELKKLVGYKAAEFVVSGMAVGLGTGSTAKYVVMALGERLGDDFSLQFGVPTSDATRELAQEVGIETREEPEVDHLDVTIDGADQIDVNTGLCIKGGGGAHYLEKKVAKKSDKLVIIVDESKLVDDFAGFNLPLEVEESAVESVANALVEKELEFEFREKKSDSGNLVCDVVFEGGDISDFAAEMMQIEGVLDTGLFEGLAKVIVIGRANGEVEVVEL